jgi:hypothetical protein
VGRVGILLSFLTLGKWFQFFPIKYNVGYRFIIYSLYDVEVYFFIPSFLSAFIMKWCWMLQKAFSASIEMIKWFLSLLLLMDCITFIYLHLLNNPCIPQMKLTWSCWMIFLTCCWSLFAIILCSIFASMFIKEIGL